MIHFSVYALAALLLASGCGAGNGPAPRPSESEYERLHAPDLARARELYASGKATEAENLLRELAADESWEVRAHSIRAIGEAKDRRLLPEVHAALKDENLEVRESAGRVLQWLGDESSVAPLLEALGDQEPVIRIRAVEALARIAGPSHIDSIEAISRNDDDPSVRAAAVEALQRIRSQTDS